MSALRQVRGPRASALVPGPGLCRRRGALPARRGEPRLRLPVRAAAGGRIRAQADRLSVLLNLDWPEDTLLQVAAVGLPGHRGAAGADAGAAHRARRRAAARGHRRSARSSCARGTDAALGPGTELRVRDLQVLVTVKLPAARGRPHRGRAQRRRGAARRRPAGAGHRGPAGPQPLTADRYVRLMKTLLNWGAGAGWRDRIVPECDPDRLIREQFLDLDRALEVDARGLRLGGLPGADPLGQALPRPARLRAGRALSGRSPLGHPRGAPQRAGHASTCTSPSPRRRGSSSPPSASGPPTWPTGRWSTSCPPSPSASTASTSCSRPWTTATARCKAYLGLVLFTPPAEAVAALSNLRTYWRELGFQVMPDQFFALPLFLHCLPFGADRGGAPRHHALPHPGRHPCGDPDAGVRRLEGHRHAGAEPGRALRAADGRVPVRLGVQLQRGDRRPVGLGQVLPHQRAHRHQPERRRALLGDRRGALLREPLRLAGRPVRRLHPRGHTLPQPLRADPQLGGGGRRDHRPGDRHGRPDRAAGRLPHRRAQAGAQVPVGHQGHGHDGGRRGRGAAGATRTGASATWASSSTPSPPPGEYGRFFNGPNTIAFDVRLRGAGARGAERPQAPPAGGPAAADLPDPAGHVPGRPRPAEAGGHRRGLGPAHPGRRGAASSRPATGAFASTAARRSPSPSPSTTSTATPPGGPSPRTAPTPSCSPSRARPSSSCRPSAACP